MDWRDEVEYRILFRSNQHHSIQDDVIYRDRCEMYNRIVSICNEKSICMERVRWTNGVPGLDPYPVEGLF